MARKVLFDSSNTLATVLSKSNQMGEWLGDLDDLTNTGDYLLGFRDANRDNSAVDAAKYLHNNLNIIREALFGPDSADSGDSGDKGTLRFEKVLVADSAVIKRMQLGQLLSPVDSNTVIRDSLDSSYGYFDSFGVFTHPPYDQRNFGGPPHQLHVTIDNGYIKSLDGSYLRLGKWLYIDSDLNKFYNAGDSYDSGDSIGNWAQRYDSDFGFGLKLDSANIVVLSGPSVHFPFPHPRRYPGDSGYTDDSSILYFESATFGRFSLATDSSYYFDSSNDSNFIADSSFFLNDSVWGNAITNTPGEINLKCFSLDFESSYDSVNFGFTYDSTDVGLVPHPYLSGFGFGNVVGEYIYHDKLNISKNEIDSQFCFTSLLEIYTDSLDAGFRPIRIFGGHLISRHDSDQLDSDERI
jgi:hypothetical protein